MINTVKLGIAALLVCWIAACGSAGEGDTKGDAGEKQVAVDDSRADGAKADDKAKPKGKTAEKPRVVMPPEGREPEPAVQRMAASHVIVAYAGALRAGEDVKRTQEQALERAKKAKAKLAGGADFAVVVKEFSDGPESEEGGRIGVFYSDRMAPEIAKAVADLDIDEELADLARRYSDCPSRKLGGVLGITGRGMMDPEFEKAAFGLEPGGISGVVETGFGYHIVQRVD